MKLTTSIVLSKKRRALWLTRKIAKYQDELARINQGLDGVDVKALIRADIAEQKRILASLK